MNKYSLFLQKLFFVCIVFGIYFGIFYGLFWLPNKHCITSNKNSSFDIPYRKNYKNDYCFIYDISVFSYNILLFIILSLTLLASIIIKIRSDDIKWIKQTPQSSGVILFIPCYSESKEEIQKTLDSVCSDTYSKKSKLLFIVLDGIVKGKNNSKTTDLYLFEIFNINKSQFEEFTFDNQTCYYLFSCYKDINYVIIIKSENKGKKHSFLLCYSFIKYINTDTNSTHSESDTDTIIHILNEQFDVYYEFKYSLNSIINWEYILILDTDTIIMPNSLNLLVSECVNDPFIIGTCGETIVNNKHKSIITMAQVFEYWISHLTLKALECYIGNVLVLSGCLALYKIEFLLNEQLISEYSEKKYNNIYKGNLLELGEDRYLTNLLLKYYPEHKTSYIQSAQCMTNVPQDFLTLLSQRRRWTNSMIFCNFMLLFNSPNYDIHKKIIFLFVLFFQLYLCFMFPLLISLSIYHLVLNIIYGISSIVLIQTLLFLLTPTILCIILGKLEMILYSIPFILLQPIYGIIIPIYSFFKVDNLSWGSTRQTE